MLFRSFADQSQLLPGSGLAHSFNYVRNSVKATVDAYDGSVHLYTFDERDPILQVWASAFPNLFEKKAALPKAIIAHLRYPEELFRVQTAAYSKYRLDAADFFDRNGAWSVALAAPDLVSGGVATSVGSTTDTTIAGSTGAAASTDFEIGRAHV